MRRALLALALQAPASLALAQAADQEPGARMGGHFNLGGLGAGGADLGGTFLYRVAEKVWIDTRAHATFGGGGEDCYLARDLSTTCDPSTLSGDAITVYVGPRLFLGPIGEWTPHLGGGAGLGYAVLPDDDLGGLVVPLWLGGGARRELRPGLWLGGELVLSGGPAYFGRGQGWGPFVALSAFASLDFGL